MPILNRDNLVIGVAQLINKKTGTHEFTAKDINVSNFVYITRKFFFSFILKNISRSSVIT
jgi:hypothetical protein